MVLKKEYVLLVDENDNALGLCEKMEAHEKALLHRAFSVLLFNEKKGTTASTKSYYQIPLWWQMDQHLLQPSTAR